jgi:hypothetical protein
VDSNAYKLTAMGYKCPKGVYKDKKINVKVTEIYKRNKH